VTISSLRRAALTWASSHFVWPARIVLIDVDPSPTSLSPVKGTALASKFDARVYWEDRLSADWTLGGVGLQRLGRRFNKWAYRVRREVFLDLIAKEAPDIATAEVLDVGVGTGFYIDRWREAGAAKIVGIDLTDAAVSNLRTRYPNTDFHRVDIGDGTAAEILRDYRFDAVSAMDVMFHIVDDDAFKRALENIRSVLQPGGLFVWSDLFVHGQGSRVVHRVSRPLNQVEALLNEAGFDVVRRTPMFVLMNEPSDTRRRWPRLVWRYAMGLAMLGEPVGGFLGWALFPLEMALVRRRTESPTTEIMVCRAR
jgi:2-polyprenyl-3-methyl-5-hydroxy-6-metoxy-1,4-benzoquinol methylase